MDVTAKELGREQARESRRKIEREKRLARAIPPPLPAGENPCRADTKFIAKLRFRNTLPPLPAEPFLLECGADDEAMGAFTLTDIEASGRGAGPPADRFLGVHVDLFHDGAYATNGDEKLDSEDEAIIAPVAGLIARARSGAAGSISGNNPDSFVGGVTWLRKAEHIHNQLTYSTYRMEKSAVPRMEGVDSREQMRTRADLAEEARRTLPPGQTVDTQREAALASFDFAASISEGMAHPTREGVVATRVVPLLPDVEGWCVDPTMVRFTSDPVPKGEEPSDPVAGEPQVLWVHMDDQGRGTGQNIYVSHYHPRKGTKRPRSEVEEGKEGDAMTYSYTREYILQNRADVEMHERFALAGDPAKDDALLFRPMYTAFTFAKSRKPGYRRPEHGVVVTCPESEAVIREAGKRFAQGDDLPNVAAALDDIAIREEQERKIAEADGMDVSMDAGNDLNATVAGDPLDRTAVHGEDDSSGDIDFDFGARGGKNNASVAGEGEAESRPETEATEATEVSATGDASEGKDDNTRNGNDDDN